MRPYTKGHSAEYSGPICCRLCGKTKPHTEFYTRHGRRRTECKVCIRAKAKHSEEQVKVGDRRWIGKRSTELKRKYGITHDDFLQMERTQEGRCALCQQKPKGRREHKNGTQWTGLHVDHDHQTGRIRGLLCVSCNAMVGKAELVGLDRLTTYLKPTSPIAAPSQAPDNP